jgi:hypothetical protein
MPQYTIVVCRQHWILANWMVHSWSDSQSESRWLVALDHLYIAALNYVGRFNPLLISWTGHLLSLLCAACCNTQGRGCHHRSNGQFCPLHTFHSSEWTWAAVRSSGPLCSPAVVEYSLTLARPTTCVALPLSSPLDSHGCREIPSNHWNSLSGDMSLCKVWQWWTLFIVFKNVHANSWRFFLNTSTRLTISSFFWYILLESIRITAWSMI